MKTAILYRMKTDKHICPFGLKALDLLRRKGFIVDDKTLKSRAEIDNFKKQQNVKTTPQIFIDNERIGGFDDLQSFFGVLKTNKKSKSYKPIAAVFSVTFGMAASVSWLANQNLNFLSVIQLFVAISMCVLAILKLRDLESFSNQFITYDLLAMRWLRYSYIYPFIEALAGLSMVAKVGLFIFAPLSFLIGLIGAVSVIKAVYIDRRDLKCACVGGNSNVPLGVISLIENLMMVLMGSIMFLYL